MGAGVVRGLFDSFLPEILALAENSNYGVLKPPNACPCVFGDISLHSKAVMGLCCLWPVINTRW